MLTPFGFQPFSLRNRRRSSGPMVRRMVGTLNDHLNTQRVSNGTDTTFNTIRCVWLKDGIVNPTLVRTGWTSGNAEADAPNAVTYRDALYSYDLATLHGEFLKDGSASHVVAGGAAWSETDVLLPYLPPGMYKIVTHGFVSSGQVFYATDYGRNNTIGARSEIGVGLADKHLSPSTISNAVANFLFGAPVGLMGTVPASRRLIGIPGDSTSVNVGSGVNPFEGVAGASAGGGMGYMAAYLDALGAYVHLGRSGYAWRTITTPTPTMTRRLAFAAAAGVTDLAAAIGINDMESGTRSAAVVQADAALAITAWKSVLPAARIWLATTLPSSAPSNLAPTTNMSDGRRLAYNNWLRAGGIPNVDGFLESAIPVQDSGNAHLWAALQSTDWLHANQAGVNTIRPALRTSNPLGL